METKLNLTMNGNELILREGKAADPLPQREPNRIRIEGDIRTVGNYVAARTSEAIEAVADKEVTDYVAVDPGLQAIDRTRAVLTVDRRERWMRLELDPENYYGVVVTGKLEPAPELTAFGINAGRMYKREELVKLLKFNSVFFADRGKHMEVIAGLMKVRVKTEAEINAHNDNRGNKGAGYEQKVVQDDGLLKRFDLKIPIYKGEEAMTFDVEVCFDVSGGLLEFWLESVRLRELELELVNSIIDKELERCPGLLVVNR